MSRDSLIKLRDRLLGTLSYEDRKWLAGELVDAEAEEFSTVLSCPYTTEELNVRFDELEKDFENADYLPADETFRMIAQELGFVNRVERIAV